jgi:RNA polymerase sigma-70 factor, ECF subfamily
MTAPSSLAQAFLDALPDPARDPWRASGEPLEAWLEATLAEATAAWPAFRIEPLRFVRFLAEKAAGLEDPAIVRKLRAPDLYLACGCLDQDAGAFAAFEEVYMPKIARALGGLRVAPSMIDDLTGVLREQLLFGRERDAEADDRASASPRPLLADFSGRGELGSWLRSITVRLAFKVLKREGKHVEGDDELDVLSSEVTPEVAYLKQAHAKSFEEALQRALASLSTRERNLLRQHYLDGLNIDALGRLHDVHRATVARWISAARDSVLASVRKELLDRMSPSEVESFLRATREELDLRLSRILRVSAS